MNSIDIIIVATVQAISLIFSDMGRTDIKVKRAGDKSIKIKGNLNDSDIKTIEIAIRKARNCSIIATTKNSITIELAHAPTH